jgi:lysophospholipase L1-like esterase
MNVLTQTRKFILFTVSLLYLSLPASAQQAGRIVDGYKRDMMPRTLTRLEEYKLEARVSPPPEEAVVFLGSATPSGWDLERWFPEFTTVKRGFGGTMIDENIKLARDVVIPHRPSTIVFYAGENDIHLGKSPELTLQHFKEFVATIREPLPDTQIIYITMKPSLLWWIDVEDMKVANRLIEDYIATQDGIYYVDTFTAMIDQQGMPRRDYLGDDDLHLTDLGYQVWSNTVRPVIKAAEANYQHLKRMRTAHAGN